MTSPSPSRTTSLWRASRLRSCGSAGGTSSRASSPTRGTKVSSRGSSVMPTRSAEPLGPLESIWRSVEKVCGAPQRSGCFETTPPPLPGRPEGRRKPEGERSSQVVIISAAPINTEATREAHERSVRVRWDFTHCAAAEVPSPPSFHSDPGSPFLAQRRRPKRSVVRRGGRRAEGKSKVSLAAPSHPLPQLLGPFSSASPFP
jgi:hypothetical protein